MIHKVILVGILMVPQLLVGQDQIYKSIYFGGGSYSIDDEQIAELSDWLDSIPNLLEKYQIQLISHTDPIGGREFNEWLSQMRSQSVYSILIRKDIPRQLITIKDWAYDNPVYSNQSFRGMRMNRRVDVVIYPMVYWFFFPFPDTFFRIRTIIYATNADFCRLIQYWNLGILLANRLGQSGKRYVYD